MKTKEKNEPTMQIKCVVACKNSEGAPDFYSCTVNCSKSQYDNGDHYDMAEGRAMDADYEGPMVVYDEKDGQRWMFNHFFSKQSDTKKAR